VESSARVAALLERDPDLIAAIAAPRRRLVTSVLTVAESHRTVLRAVISGRLSAERGRDAVRDLNAFMERVFLLDLSRAVVTRAGHPFPVEPVRTLDALHLASIDALHLTPQLVTVLTRDVRVRSNVVAMGYRAE
jgi:hypothetical protein